MKKDIEAKRKKRVKKKDEVGSWDKIKKNSECKYIRGLV